MSHKEKRTVAFVMHPLSVAEFKGKEYLYSPWDKIICLLLNIIPTGIVKKFYSNLFSHVFIRVENIESRAQKKIDFIGIMCPVFPDEIFRDRDKSIGKVLASVRLAINQGADIVVLAGYTSIVCDQGILVKSRLMLKDEVAITSGNTLTAALCIDGVMSACEFFDFDITKLAVTIVGATGDIGGMCASMLLGKVKELTLCSRKQVTNRVFELNNNDWDVQTNVKYESNIKAAVKCADLVILATSSFSPLVAKDDIKPYSIICDVSLPYNVEHDVFSSRKDVFVFDGGRAMLEAKQIRNTKWNTFVSDGNNFFGCLAEGMTLGFENRLEHFSLGREVINKSKILEIKRMAAKHGVTVAGFAFHGNFYSQSDLDSYKLMFSKAARK